MKSIGLNNARLKNKQIPGTMNAYWRKNTNFNEVFEKFPIKCLISLILNLSLILLFKYLFIYLNFLKRFQIKMKASNNSYVISKIIKRKKNCMLICFLLFLEIKQNNSETSKSNSNERKNYSVSMCVWRQWLVKFSIHIKICENNQKADPDVIK